MDNKENWIQITPEEWPLGKRFKEIKKIGLWRYIWWVWIVGTFREIRDHGAM